jgi:hypothetical protein
MKENKQWQLSYLLLVMIDENLIMVLFNGSLCQSSPSAAHETSHRNLPRKKVRKTILKLNLRLSTNIQLHLTVNIYVQVSVNSPQRNYDHPPQLN